MSDPRNVYRLLYEFKASEPVELTVKKGQIVVEAQNAQHNEEWLLVETLNGAERGYVPVNFVQVLPPSEAERYLQDNERAKAPKSEPLPVATSTPASVHPYSPAQPQAPPVVSSAPSALPSTFGDMFQRHDTYFQQVAKQREEAFRKLETSLTSAAQEISICQEKNSKLTQRIVELDSMIEEERRKWRERLETEKKNLLLLHKQ